MSKTNQPQWKRIDNLGDVHPIDYGGFFVYVDRTGVYAPEVELLDSPDSDDAPEGWTIHRAVIKKDPAGEWWFPKLREVAASIDMDVSELERMAMSESVVTRAMVYQYLFHRIRCPRKWVDFAAKRLRPLIVISCPPAIPPHKRDGARHATTDPAAEYVAVAANGVYRSQGSYRTHARRSMRDYSPLGITDYCPRSMSEVRDVRHLQYPPTGERH